MKTWKGYKWCLVFLGLTLLCFYGALAYAIAIGGTKWVHIAYLASGVQGCILAVAITLPYSLVTKRWYSLAGACTGCILFYPAAIAIWFALMFVLNLVYLLAEAWKMRMYIRLLALLFAVLALVFFIRREKMQKQFQQFCAGDSSTRGGSRTPEN
jgi:hypothetical protein